MLSYIKSFVFRFTIHAYAQSFFCIFSCVYLSMFVSFDILFVRNHIFVHVALLLFDPHICHRESHPRGYHGAPVARGVWRREAGHDLP
jgi:hypothetical protein